ncbi:hypothetical protein BCR35DRAFT_310520 [Leucosporidium creatinivorum]|uniref:Transcription initiation factor TFIID subunit 1 histone acetyltransferase domain-containing protein n=1 Tax=Leucosporidium creatinivorum TaxID=106004 RepID=A0A1Y2D479_9BASI|nr:hypothetical protein BCR35DRAFT_310520 [Leucosporidium creatinivorum]
MSVEPLAPPPMMKQANVKDLFPDFDYGKTLDFTDLFGTRPRKKQKTKTESVKLALPTPDELPRNKSSRDALLAPLRPIVRDSRLRNLLIQSQEREREAWEDEGSSDEELLKAIERSNRHTKAKWEIPADSETAFEMAELDDWEDKIIWGPSGSDPSPHLDPLAHRNVEFESGSWLKSIIWSSSRPYKDFTSLNLNLNDTQMLLEVQQPSINPEQDAAGRTTTVSNLVEREKGLDPFNMSNDREYEVTKDVKKKIRQTFGLLEVQHAYPALKLQLPFYKTRLTKSDLRSFHRPALQFPANVPITFTKSRTAKKRKDKQGRKIKRGDGDALRHMTDITLKDTSPFLLWEYSEENPPIISNVGMGSILVNYYRKINPEDTFVPQLDLGEPFLLEGTDESPFKAFGYVKPGETVPTLYNNLIRAPIWRHKPPETDFLVVRSSAAPSKGETKYYIRDIKNLFVVGQTYPLNEVPGPHSRKITTLVKNRLQTIAYKLVAKSPRNRIKVHKLTRYFPDQNDLQMRQRLKEFMEFNRKGPDQGFWMIKKSIQVPDDAEMLKLATPEAVCLSESMQVGLRHLQDAGYGQAEEGGAGDDDSKLDIEQQLAPWITTKNFINATANKAMLKLHGEGDPTGRGEAFSFLRVSMKDIFLRAGEAMEDRMAEMANRPKSAHRYNVQEQQEVYKEEISRIWKAQWASLSDPNPPVLTQADEERARGSGKRGGSTVAETPAGMGSLAGTPRGRAGTPDSENGEGEGSVASGKTGGYGQNKTLRIKRLVNGKWETEIVREPTIIGAYVRQRQLIEEEKTEADDLLPSDDEGKNERHKKRLKEQLEKLKRNQERRLARKNQKLGIPTGAIGVGGKRAVKTETTRICGNCGQRGHMKTSKKLCPRWHEFNAPKSAEPSGALPSNFGGGLALPSMGAAPTPVQLAPKPAMKLKMAPGQLLAQQQAAQQGSPPPPSATAPTTPRPPASEQM